MKPPELQIAIAAAVPIVPARYRRPAMTDPLDVSHEMDMVKAALLYGDRVSVASWRVSMVNAWARMRDRRRAGDAAELVRLLAAVEWARARRGVQSPSPGLRTLAEIPVEELTVDAVRSAVGGRLDEIDQQLDRALTTTGWRELSKAVELGVLDVRPMGEATGFGFSREAAVAEYLHLLADLTEPTSEATPMLDYSAAGALEVGSKVGILKHALPRSSSEVALAAHYVGYLPTFERADLMSVLKARESLKAPLIRFRSLMSELAREIESSPTEPGFRRAADDLFRREVAPQLEEVADLSRERGLLRVARDELAESQGGVVVRAAIGLAAASVAGLPEIARAAVGALVAAAEIASSSYTRRRAVDARWSAHRLLWMYKLEQKLQSTATAE